MSEPLSAEERERLMESGIFAQRMVEKFNAAEATIDALTAERDHYVKSWKNRLEALAAAEAQVERYRENCKKLAADAGDAMTRESASLREVERYREVVTFALGVLRSSTMTWEQRGAVTYDALARLDADPPREPTERNEG